MCFQDQLSLNAGQKYCRMLEHSAILSTCIELPLGYKTFVLSIFELSLKTGFTVVIVMQFNNLSNNILVMLCSRRDYLIKYCISLSIVFVI